MKFRSLIPGFAAVVLLASNLALKAQELKPTETHEAPSDGSSTSDTAVGVTRTKSGNNITTLAPVVVTAQAPDNGFSSVEQSTPPLKTKYQLPVTTHSTDAEHIHETVNIVDTEDAVKYFPSLFLRKRNNGDPQAVLQTRTWGLNSSARSLVYADDILLSALIGNNNTTAAPRWGLVSPEEIDRIDFLYGPFSAGYPGNSEGGVLLITTKMPSKLVVDGSQTESFQTFSLYKTRDTFRTDESNIEIGNKIGSVSWLVTGSYENTYSQPLYIITNGSVPAGTTGTIPAANKTGATADVVGAGGIQRSQYTNINGKVAWDITPTLKATFTTGFFLNDTNASVQSYLQSTATSQPTFAGVSGFASDEFNFYEEHLASSFSLRTDTQDNFDWDFSFSNYYYLDDVQKNPLTASATNTGFSPNGTITSLTGTNWQNGDLKGIYRPTGVGGEHEISFGIHADRYFLDNPTYATPDWTSGADQSGTEYSDGEGMTVTQGIWIQDAWRYARDWKLTVGGRLENWAAEDGFNLASIRSGTGAITSSSATHQPGVDAVRFSPKAAFDWTPSKEWEYTASFGEAYRFPTVSELYQTVTSGPTIVVPNPDLVPEDDFSAEVAAERHFDDGTISLSLFNDYVKNALISQTNFVGGSTPLTFITNVNQIRNTGVELDAQKDNVLVHGLDFFGNATYVNSEILSDPSFQSTTGVADAAGKRVPYVPVWRTTFGVTEHPIDALALTAALHYSGKQYSTLDNSDTTNGVFGAFDSFLTVDLHAQYKIKDQFFVDVGIDNVNNEKYFLYHPFPQRTYVASLRMQF